jgi:hypothetical protein
MGEEMWDVFVGVHRMLLRLAGRVPDEWLTHTRELLGGGDLFQLPDTVVGSMATLGMPLTTAEVELLRTVMFRYIDDREPLGLDKLLVSEVTPATDYRFSPVSAEVLAMAGGRIPAALDLTGGPSDDLTDLPERLADLADLADDLTDPLDDRVVDNLTYDDGVTRIWRTWRFAPGGSPDDGRRVFLVEVATDILAWDLAYDAQRELADMGETFPQVEVYWAGDDLTPYHRAARDHSTLLWASSAAG